MKRGKEEASELLRMFQKLFPYSRYVDLVPTLPVIPTYHAVRKRKETLNISFKVCEMVMFSCTLHLSGVTLSTGEIIFLSIRNPTRFLDRLLFNPLLGIPRNSQTVYYSIQSTVSKWHINCVSLNIQLVFLSGFLIQLLILLLWLDGDYIQVASVLVQLPILEKTLFPIPIYWIACFTRY